MQSKNVTHIRSECLFYHDGCLIRGRNGTDHPSGGPWVQLYFFGGIVLLIFLVFCVVFYFANLVLCLVFPMLQISLNYPFLIAPSVFANVLSNACFRFMLFFVILFLCVELWCWTLIHFARPVRFIAHTTFKMSMIYLYKRLTMIV
jgi:hypothetical protein